MYVYLCRQCPPTTDESIKPSEIGIIEYYKWPCEYWEPNPGLQLWHQMLLTTKSFLQFQCRCRWVIITIRKSEIQRHIFFFLCRSLILTVLFCFGFLKHSVFSPTLTHFACSISNLKLYHMMPSSAASPVVSIMSTCHSVSNDLIQCLHHTV